MYSVLQLFALVFLLVVVILAIFDSSAADVEDTVPRRCQFTTMLKSTANKYFAVAPSYFDGRFTDAFVTDIEGALSDNPNLTSAFLLSKACECAPSESAHLPPLPREAGAAYNVSVDRIQKYFLEQKDCLAVDFSLSLPSCTAASPSSESERRGIVVSTSHFARVQHHFFKSLARRDGASKLKESVFVFPDMTFADIKKIVESHDAVADDIMGDAIDDGDDGDQHDDIRDKSLYSEYGEVVVKQVVRLYSENDQKGSCNSATCVVGVCCAILAILLVVGALVGCCVERCAENAREKEDERRLLLHSSLSKQQ